MTIAEYAKWEMPDGILAKDLTMAQMLPPTGPDFSMIIAPLRMGKCFSGTASKTEMQQHKARFPERTFKYEATKRCQRGPWLTWAYEGEEEFEIPSADLGRHMLSTLLTAFDPNNKLQQRDIYSDGEER